MPTDEISSQKLYKAFECPKPTETIETDQGPESVEEFAKREGFEWTDVPLAPRDIASRSSKAPKDFEKEIKINYARQILADCGIIFENNPNLTNITSTLKKYGDQIGVSSLSDLSYSLQVIEKKLDAFLNSPNHNKLVVRLVNEIIGKGVFVSPIGKPIKKGQIVSIYSGSYESPPKDNTSFLTYGLTMPRHAVFSENFASHTAKGNINAQKYGNISRYFNDFPTEDELTEYYTVNPEKVKQIATANINLYTAYYKSCPIAFFEANQDITGQVCFSFGTSYWAKAECLKNIKRCLFYKDGSMVNEQDYICKFLNIEIKLSNNSSDYAAFKVKDLKEYLLNGKEMPVKNDTTEKMINLNKQDILSALAKKLSPSSNDITLSESNAHMFRFSISMRLILQDFLIDNAYPGDNKVLEQKVNYVKELETAIANCKLDQADDIFNLVREKITTEPYSSFFKEHLKEVRSDIINAMKNYNNDKKLSENAQSILMQLKKN